MSTGSWWWGWVIGVGALATGWNAASIGGTLVDEARRDARLEAVGQYLFEQETFGGNGRTCVTCHTRETGTISPVQARELFARNPDDALFRADGSDDGQGHGARRMLADATVLVRIPLPENVTLANDPAARSVVLPRGIPTTLNAPALDPVLMWDGRHGSLEAQALGAIEGHAAATEIPTTKQLEQIAIFERARPFFTSDSLWTFASTGRAPALPIGLTEPERRGRRFFVDAPFARGNFKDGLCAFCHSGPMLNETNEFIPVAPKRRGGRFQTALVSELNPGGRPVIDFLFKNADGTTTKVSSPDPGRALITGKAKGDDQLNAFKIPTLWGVEKTAPYFHDNSAKTLEDLVRHYAKFFAFVTDPKIDGDPAIELTEQDQADIVAFLKLLR